MPVVIESQSRPKDYQFSTFSDSNTGKPLIHWEQETQTASKRKDYLTKKGPYPLRNKQPVKPTTQAKDRLKQKAKRVENKKHGATANTAVISENQLENIHNLIAGVKPNQQEPDTNDASTELKHNSEQKTEHSNDVNHPVFEKSQLVGNRNGQTDKEPPVHVSSSDHNQSSTEPEQNHIPMEQHALSLSDKKRMQWAKEKAELQAISDPWGKPGGGAPTRHYSGSPFNHHTNSTVFQTDRQPDILKDNTNKPDKFKEASVPSLQINHPNNSQQHAAIRSNLEFGFLPADDKYSSRNALEKEKWLADLARQVEEKRDQKNESDKWAEHTGRLPIEGIRSGNSLDTSPRFEAESHKSFLLGQNSAKYLDPQTKKELDDKRRRHIEHHNAVKKQVEERERERRLERERRVQEELAEEARLLKQREMMQLRLEAEQQKQKEKELEEERRIADLKAAMDAAAEQARILKQQKRLKHVARAGYNPEDRRKSVPEAPTTTSKTPIVIQEYDTGKALDDSSRLNQSGFSIAPVNDQGYIENRILTPSSYRHRNNPQGSPPPGTRKEFATQTDLEFTPRKHKAYEQFSDKMVLAREFSSGSVGAEYKPEREVKPRRKSDSNLQKQRGRVKQVRVNSGANKVIAVTEDLPVPKPEKPSKPVPLNKRPSWGYMNTNKRKPVRQSERDPHYQKRREQRERAKKERQRKMHAQVAANAEHIPEKPTARSRSRSSHHSPHPSDTDDANNVSSKNSPRKSRLDSHLDTTLQSDSKTSILSNKRRQRSVSYENKNNADSDTEKPATSRAQSVSERLSPPVPALMKKMPEYQQQSPRSPIQKQTEQSRGTTEHRSLSPPVPTLRHKLNQEATVIRSPRPSLQTKTPAKQAIQTEAYENDFGMDRHQFDDGRNSRTSDEPFVPYLRSSDVLDSERAAEPVTVSREATSVQKARSQYLHSKDPAHYGEILENHEDERPKRHVSYSRAEYSNTKDPITNPALVIDRPTPRQGEILRQLSSLKQGLKQKQRQADTYSTSDFFRDTGVPIQQSFISNR